MEADGRRLRQGPPVSGQRRGAAIADGAAVGTVLLAGLVLALSNFMVVLDPTIANVSVAAHRRRARHLADRGHLGDHFLRRRRGDLRAVDRLARQRFGEVRVFVAGMIGFGLFSFLCGIAPSLGASGLFRIGQGLAGGPIMPISQTLLLRLFPKERHGQATGIWAMTTHHRADLRPDPRRTISDNLGLELDLLHQRADRRRLRARLRRAAPQGGIGDRENADRLRRPGAPRRRGRRASDHARPRPRARLVRKRRSSSPWR